MRVTPLGVVYVVVSVGLAIAGIWFAIHVVVSLRNIRRGITDVLARLDALEGRVEPPR